MPSLASPRHGSSRALSLAIALCVSAAPAAAQSTPPVIIRAPSSSENPPAPPLPSAIVPPVIVPVIRPQTPTVAPNLRTVGPASGPPPALLGDDQRPPEMHLPAPVLEPMEIDSAHDPLLQSVAASADPEAFRAVVQHAIEHHPALDESAGYANEARYALYQQRAALAPSAEIDISGFKVIARDFGDDSIDNIVERTRADHRADELVSVNQLLTDFGATGSRVDAAAARLRSAALGVDSAAEQVALNTIAAWYDVYSLRTILAITRAYREDQLRSRSAIAQRVQRQVTAPVDAALVDNAIAQIDIRLARFEQQLASSEARFRELTGSPPPPVLMRAPELGRIPATIEQARAAADTSPATRAAQFQSDAAEKDARAARRDLLPSVSASIDGGRYGLLESRRNYDLVARVTLRQRLFGGLPQRAKAAGAHAEAQEARARRIEEENARDAATAFSDLAALDQQVEALEQSYIATRRTRDATKRRFDVARGTLFDVLNASDTFYAAAVGYVQALAQRDAGRYVLLARTGALLDALQVPTYVIPD